MVTRESQITAQIVLNNQPNSNTTEMKQTTRNLKKFTNCSYRTRPICHCSSDFWTIRTVQLKNHEVWTCWQNFSTIQRWTKQQQQSENSRPQKKRWKGCCSVRWISLCSNNLCKIRTVRVKSHKVWTDDKILARSNGEQSVGGGRKLLSEIFSLFNIFSHCLYFLLAILLFEKP